MKIIAFGHRSEVGKDTAARLLISQVRAYSPQIKIHRRGLADPLKEFGFSAFEWAGVQPASYYENNPRSKNDILPVLGISARKLWIDIGTFYNSIHPEVFCNLAMQHCGDDILVISDLRRRKEVDFFSKFQTFIPVRVDAPTDVVNTLDNELADYDKWAGVIDNSAMDIGILNEQLKPYTKALVSDNTMEMIRQMQKSAGYRI